MSTGLKMENPLSIPYEAQNFGLYDSYADSIPIRLTSLSRNGVGH